MKFEITNRWNGSVLFSLETSSLKLAVVAAVRAGANLRGANLCGANLCGANLYEADLYGANLYGADLYGANLCGANLYGANLCGADLYGANLREANLYGANLRGANLCGANLCGANLYEAKNLERFPISILGHKHGLFTTMDGQLQIGCHVHSFDEWMRHTEKIGKAENYSPLDVEIYLKHIKHIKEVSELLWAKKEEVEKVSA